MTIKTDIAVVGAGLSGLLTTLALSHNQDRTGLKVALFDAGKIDRPAADGRATTLTPNAVTFMKRIGVSLPDLEPVTAMRVGEGEGDSPWQFELPQAADMPLAYVVANSDLRLALLDTLKSRIIQRVESLQVEDMTANGTITLQLSNQDSVEAELCIACDGRQSALRRIAGISLSEIDFKQRALVTTVEHEEPHEGIALQRFQTVGAIASLPLPGFDQKRSQIVWSDRDSAILAASKLPSEALAALIDERLWGSLDVRNIVDEIQTYPLLGRRSDALCAERLVLVGDAARTIHPLAGQGFNLAIRDVELLFDRVHETLNTGQDIGVAGLIGYVEKRRADETRFAALTTLLSSAPNQGIRQILGHIRRLGFAATDDLTVLHPLVRQQATSSS